MTTAPYPKMYLYRRIVQAKLYIDACYSDKINLNHISNEACFSKFHFIRLFKSVYGKTPHQYLTAVRIGHAKRLLQQGRSVSEVCFQVGYDSVSTFSGLFANITGNTPAGFQSSCQQRRTSIQAEPLAFVPGCYAMMHGWIENSNFEEAKV